MGQDCFCAKNCHHLSFPYPCWPDKLNSVLHTRVYNIELPDSAEGGNSMAFNQDVRKGNIGQGNL